MKKMRILLMLVIVSLSAVACASHYCGSYRLAGFNGGHQPKFNDLEAQIDGVVQDFGLRVETYPSGYRLEGSWRSHKELVAPELSRLKGSDSNITIYVTRDLGLDISISDWDNDEETEFVRALKQRIEKLLEEHYGVREPRFRKQRFDPFS